MVSVRHAGAASGDSDGEAAETAAGHHGQTQSALQKRMSFQMQSQGLQLEVSDGLGTAKTLINREVISELTLYQKHISVNTVLVIRGQISRYSSEDGQTAFILNECPRLVLNEVTC